ncbi:MAG: leucine-rich repeat domain-containing protein [Promethearchaeota archaeon]
MELKPSKVYENYRNRSLDELSIINLLITLIDNNEEDFIRKECIDVLNKIDCNDEEVFRILENIILSEGNEDLRSSAARVIGNKFLKRALNPFLWVLQYETSYECLITILRSFQENNDVQLLSKFTEEINKISIDKFSNCLNSFFTKYDKKKCVPEDFVEFLVNHITIKHLLNKFGKLKYKIENGFVTELDFSYVDNLIINWRDRENLKDHSVILGIENLKYLKMIKFFPIEWISKNEFTYKCSIALIKALERLNNGIAKIPIIDQLNRINDKKFHSSINSLLKQIENLPLSKLSNILRNYLTLSFLRKKNPSMEYEFDKGEVISISIRGEVLISIPNFVKYLSSLHSISLKYCSLYTIPKSIGSFPNLKVLDLEGNKLKILPKSISSLKSLRLLNLKKNQLIKIPYSFGQLHSLRYLNLESNDIMKLPSSIGDLSSLKYLNVRDNKLQELPPSIGNLKSLQILNLSSNKLNQLPQSVGLLYSLETLNLDNNNLKQLPNAINSISSLKTLTIEDNNLRSLPESLILLKSLESLNLGWNKIHKLPNSIEKLVSLKHLQLMNNKLEHFPDSICFLTSLECLDASSNYIKNLPHDFGNLKSLKILKLSDNQIKILPGSICKLSLLEKLNFSGNRIEFLPESFGLLQSLKEILLNENNLSSLPESIIELKSLRKLKLNNNPLATIPKTL